MPVGRYSFLKMYFNISQKSLVTNFTEIIKLFKRKDRAMLLILLIAQVLLSLLDLLGVAMIGIIGALAVRGVQSQGPGDRVSYILEILKINDETLQVQVSIIGVIVSIALIGRTLLSVTLTKKSLLFLSRRSAKLSSDLLSRALDLNLVDLRTKSSQEFLFSLTHGVNILMLGIVGSAISLIADITILLVLSSGLFLVDTAMALASLSLFATIALILFKLQYKKALYLGERDSREQIFSNTKIIEVFTAYREFSVRNRKYFAFQEIHDSRFRLAKISAERAFMPSISKYTFEVALILGVIIICGIQFLTEDASRAVGTLSVFLAAGTRIAPAIMRMQTNAIGFKSGFGEAESTLETIRRLGNLSSIQVDTRSLVRTHIDFEARVFLSRVNFQYPGSDSFALKNIDFELFQGESCGLVGDSGAGKSTLADLILGVIEPQSGTIQISNLSPREVIQKWPGAIGYVPQDTFLTRGTIKENICLGFDPNCISDEMIWDSLEMASLKEYVKDLSKGIETLIGDGEKALSGGQRQRIGIARALLSRPKLVIFDEATSSLDNRTEREITETLNKLRNDCTLIIIAHRYSTIQGVDKIALMKSGRIVDFGPKNRVLKENPDLAMYFPPSTKN